MTTETEQLGEAPAAQSDNWAVVLLVDDQALIAEGIRRMMADQPDIQFHYCADPRQAIQQAVNVKATVILQDLVMPDVDGLTLVRFYRNNPATRDIPVIVLSSKDDPNVKSDAFYQGATDYLVKLPEKVELLARYSAVPVINALTDQYHPCQLLADMLTWFERRGDIQGATVAFIGDGNNMCHSYINAATRFDFRLNIATPAGYKPDPDIVAAAGERIGLSEDPLLAARDADLVVTDVWASMGQEEEQAKRERAFSGFQVNSELMAQAASDALFMHCLPAHRGEEVTAEVIDGPQSVVWDEAENRLHAQKALLELLLT